MKRLALVCVIGLTACVTTPEQRILIACDSYATTLHTLAIFRQAGSLSESDIEMVDDTRSVLNPICDTPNPPDTREALRKVEDGILRLILLKRQQEAT